MKKTIILLWLCCVAVYSYAQEHRKSLQADTIKSRWLVGINWGLSKPEAQYRKPGNVNNPEQYTNDIQGMHIDATTVFLISKRIGIAGRIAYDWNYFPGDKSSDKLNQYMAGFYAAINPKENRWNTYFMLMAGLVTAHLAPGYTVLMGAGDGGYFDTPGFGAGFGMYMAPALSCHLSKRLYADASAGLMESWLNFSNCTQTKWYYTYNLPPYPPTTVTTITTFATSRNLAAIQLLIGLHYYL